MDLISLLITLLIYGLVLSIIWWAVEQIPMVAPFAWAVRVVFAIIVVILLLSLIGGGVPVIRGPLLR